MSAGSQIPPPLELARLAATARMYFIDEVSQVDIAKELGVSRFRVARMIAQARELGIVQIRVREELTLLHDLGQELAERFGLKAAHVVPAWGSVRHLRTRVAQAAGRLLEVRAMQGEVVGIGWGRTLADVSQALSDLPRVTVVQLTGAVVGELAHSPVEILRRIALQAGGAAMPIFAPMVLDSAETAASIRKQPQVDRALRYFDKLAHAMLAIGSWDPLDSQLAASLSVRDRQRLCEQGVQAEVAGILLTGQGQITGQHFTDRCISISAQQLRSCPDVIGVVAGKPKGRAVAAVCRSGLITSLVCDHQLAELLLELTK